MYWHVDDITVCIGHDYTQILAKQKDTVFKQVEKKTAAYNKTLEKYIPERLQSTTISKHSTRYFD